MKPTHHLFTTLALVGQVLALGDYGHTSATVQFREPPKQYRPKFRYWLPDASVTHDSVQGDIRNIENAGGGGLEFLSFYNYGLGPALTDWSIYGFGTEAFKKLFHAALNTSVALDMQFDFAFGANQGAGVPSEAGTPGLAKHLVYGNTTVQSGETFSGKVPEPIVEFNEIKGFMNPLEPWGPNELVGVVAAKVLSETLLAEYFYLSVLDETTLVDLTNITDEGSLTWTAPEGNGTWVLFAVYERYTNQRSCVSVVNATTVLGNGSWMVDHWSATGAKKMTDFWDQQILSDESIAALVRELGAYAWEDSMEMQAALPWTPNLFSRFEELHGYSVTPYLPVLFHPTNAWGGYLPPYNITYTFAAYDTDGGPYVQDYKTTISKGYIDYVEHYNQWASSKGVYLSNQPGYNMPVEMADAVSHVQIPELESLGFEESTDSYRQFTGAAHLAGRNIISTEIGAIHVGAYKLHVPELKQLFDGSFAAGVNTMVIHGYAYSGEYVNTTWPGYTPFQYEYTDMWNQRQPAWQHIDDLFMYSARNTMIMRSGVPKVDLAFYYYQNPYKITDKVFPGSEMNKYGYTMEFLGAGNLESEEAVVVDGVLAPKGPAFQAMVIYNQTQITPNASAALLEFAQNGLPIFIVGSIPNTTVGATGQQEVSENIEKLLSYEVVHVIKPDDFSASTLAEAGVPARTRVDAAPNATSLYTFWTSDVQSKSEFVYLDNQGADGVFNVTILVQEGLSPYVFDAWTGTQLPLAIYERNATAVKMEIKLRANQTTIIGFMPAETQQREHVVNQSPNVHAVRFTGTGSLEAWVSDNSSAWLTTSNGSKIALPAGDTTSPATTNLDSWNLTVEAHGPNLAHPSIEPNITAIDVGKLDHLAPWTEIPGLEQVSGIGTYRTRFDISTNNSNAIMIAFGPVLNTMKAWLNGKQVPAIDPTNPVVDVSDLVLCGSNVMEVQVTTTLFNAVKANIDHVLSIGSGPETPSYYTDADWEKSGLVGPVTLKSYRRVLL